MPAAAKLALAWYCQGCGKRFGTLGAAQRASSLGCPRCNSGDIDQGKPSRAVADVSGLAGVIARTVAQLPTASTPPPAPPGACSTCRGHRIVDDGACPDCARIAIVGGPKTGKTTLANQLDVCALHTDDVAHLGWSEASEAASLWFDVPGPKVVEGVAVARALRKWLSRTEVGRPCDVLIVLSHPFVELTVGQVSMGKGIVTVLKEIEAELVRRGVRIARVQIGVAA